MSSSAAPAIPGYSDFELVAHGSTAFVYRAVQERLDRTVAVKVLLVDDDMTTADSVEKELEATVAVSNHPHIVSIIDTGTDTAGRPYIVMEYCEGGSYSAILKASGPLSVEDVIDVGVKIGQALQAAHNADILHRDVKPQNILRGQYGPALADFGIARTPAALAATAAIDKLTPLHASPEALLRHAQTAASDLFSLASSMWHLLAGFAPFANPEGGTDPDTHRERVTSETPPPTLPRDDVPEWLEHLLMQALERDPARRPESCQAFADALQRGVYGSSSSGVGTAPAPQRITDLSAEETVYRPEGPPMPRSHTEPLDPFAPVGANHGPSAPVGANHGPSAPVGANHGPNASGPRQHPGGGGADGIPLGATQQYAGSPPAPDSAYTLGGTTGGMTSGVTGGRTAGPNYNAQLGTADPGYLALNGTAQASAPPISAAPHSVIPQSAAPMSAPPQAPVSMNPPSMPWAPPQQAPAPVSPTPQQQTAFPPPVISRDKQKPPKAPKTAAPPDPRGLKSYVVLGLVITVVLGVVMTSWLWFINRPGAADDVEDPEALDLAQIDGDGKPANVRIESWSGGELMLAWDPPVENANLEYVVISQRVGEDEKDLLDSTTDTSLSVSGLNPAADYCFFVGAIWAYDEMPTAEPVCTNGE